MIPSNNKDMITNKIVPIKQESVLSIMFTSTACDMLTISSHIIHYLSRIYLYSCIKPTLFITLTSAYNKIGSVIFFCIHGA